MAKEAYYFSHDSNARQDPKILAMMSVYGPKGYGWYWILVEMMREQDGHTLSLQGKYSFNAIAMQMHSNSSEAEQFVHDCIDEFELFESDGQTFWSNSLLRRMAMKEEISQKRKRAAEKRWNKEKESKEDTDDMQMHNDSNANAMQGKEKKVKESKEKEDKELHLDYVYLKPYEYERLIGDYGKTVVDSKIEDLDNYLTNKGPNKFKDHNKTLRNWLKKDGVKTQKEKQKENEPSLNEQIQELNEEINLGRQYYKEFETEEEYDNLVKERDRLEQLRVNQGQG